ncbi:MAG: CDP-alcohol phosphatidyltransferase family protein [Candidatus Omnitrophica bacterium]|nr:CDP-alcohol phosphatidyltransferase family protein [Candidatus Omnitrophota bacterium]
MNFADKISLLRIFLIPVFVALLIIYSRLEFEYLKYTAAGVFILAVLTDFFDGLVARIKKEKSEIGKVIDPLADKLLLVTAFITLYFLKFSIPWWVVLIVVSRDLIIFLGVGVLYFFKIGIPTVPSIWGKFTTFFQMFTVLSVCLDFPFSHFIWVPAVVFTLISGVGYIRKGIFSLNSANIKKLNREI